MILNFLNSPNNSNTIVNTTLTTQPISSLFVQELECQNKNKESMENNLNQNKLLNEFKVKNQTFCKSYNNIVNSLSNNIPRLRSASLASITNHNLQSLNSSKLNDQSLNYNSLCKVI